MGVLKVGVKEYGLILSKLYQAVMIPDYFHLNYMYFQVQWHIQ